MLCYIHMAAKDLKKMFARVPAWPQEAQEELARSMKEIEARYSRIYHVDDDERIALEQSAEDMRTDKFATVREVEAVFGQFHRA
jgi:hypothetical protein